MSKRKKKRRKQVSKEVTAKVDVAPVDPLDPIGPPVGGGGGGGGGSSSSSKPPECDKKGKDCECPSEPDGVPSPVAPVDLADGSARLRISLSSQDSFAIKYNNKRAAASDELGGGWRNKMNPVALATEEGIVMEAECCETLEEVSEGTFESKFGTSTVTTDSEGNWRHEELDGSTKVFDSVSGSLLKTITPGGIETDYTIDPMMLRPTQTQTVTETDGVTSTQTRSFEYSDEVGVNFGRLIGSTLTRSTGTSALSSAPIESVTLEYYEEDIPGVGNAGDLKRVIRSTSGETEPEVDYFRYYTSNSSVGFKGGLKFAFNSAQYSALVASVGESNLDSASDAAVSPFAGIAYEYGAQRRITKFVGCGGLVNEMTYTENPNPGSDPFNDWVLKTTYTTLDGDLKKLFSSKVGLDLLIEDLKDGGSWIFAYRYNSKGDRIAKIHPSAIDDSISAYDESASDLNIQVKADEGLIEVTNWTPEGKIESRSLQRGENGTPIPQVRYEYELRDAGSQSAWFVTKEIKYRSDDVASGGDPVETTFDRTWFPGTLQAQTLTTNLPDVGAGQNGSADTINNQTIEEYNSQGQTVRQTDERGTVTEFAYDPATGSRIRMIQDATGMQLTTDYEVDSRGRTVQMLGPVHDVDGQQVRTASWTAYVNRLETVTGQGYQNASGDMVLVNPVQVQRKSSDGTVVDSITATRGSAVESAGALESSDQFLQSGWVAWSQQRLDLCGKLEESRTWHNIPASGEGMPGSNFHSTLYGYDVLHRQIRIQTPDGTIRRQVLTTHGETKSTWIGTDDTGATASDPTGAAAIGNDMVMLSRNEFDQNQSGQNRLLTKSIVRQDEDPGNDRVTTFEYDWRNRQVASVAEGPAFNHVSRQTLDNMNRELVTESLSDDGTGEVPVSRSQTLFDNRSRSYRNIREGVDQQTGVLTGETIVVDMEFDATGKPVRQTPVGGGDFMTFEYDVIGRQTLRSNALGESISVTFNEANLSIASTDAMGNTSTMDYDPIGRLLKSVNALGQTVSEQEYDAAGRLKAQTNGEGERTEFAYDDAGRQTSVTDPAGNVLSTSYDSMGRALQIQDPLGNFVSAQYDLQGRQTTAIDQMLDVTESVFDLAGNIVEVVDAKGKSTFSSFDKLGRKVTTTDRLGHVTSFEFDRAGRQSKIIDAEGGATVYGFDAFGRPSTTQYPDHVDGTSHGDLDFGIVSVAFDSKDRPTVRTDQKGNSVTHNFDAAGRLTSRDHREHGSAAIVDSDTFTYDANGLMLSAKSGRYNNEILFNYDAAGRKSNETLVVGQQSYTTSYTYDAASRISSMTYPDGSVVDRSYDPRGLLEQVDFEGSMVDMRSYDAAGRVQSSTYGNGATTSWTHRADGLIDSIATTNSGSEKVGTYSYTWDSNKNKKSESISGAGFMSGFGFDVGASGYDDEDRLLSFQRTDGNLDQNWSLSPVGDWNQKTENSIQTNYTNNAAHETTAIDSTPISYDANGNPQVSSGGDSLQWDSDNRLISAGNHSFEYDALGRRVQMDEGSGSKTLVCPNAQLVAIYDSGASSANPQQVFVYGSYIDEPLMTQVGGDTFYYHRNQQFSITALTDETANVAERYAYDACGKTLIMSPVGAMLSESLVDNRFCYTGRFLHADLGVMYFRARYYDSATGEFISRDPLEYVDGMSLYRGYFVPGMVDPLGTYVVGDPPAGHDGNGGRCCECEYQACVKKVHRNPGNAGIVTGVYRCERKYQACLKEEYPDGKTRVCCGERYNPKTHCCENKKIVARDIQWKLDGFDSLEACVSDCMWNETKGNGTATTVCDGAAAGGGGAAGGLLGAGIGSACCPVVGTAIGTVVGACIGGGAGAGGSHTILVRRCKSRCSVYKDCSKKNK